MARRLAWLLALMAIAPGMAPPAHAAEPPVGRQWTRAFTLLDLANPFFDFWDGTTDLGVNERVASFRAYFEPKQTRLMEAGVFARIDRRTFYDTTLPAYMRSLVLDPMRVEAIKLRKVRLQHSIPLLANRLQTVFAAGELRLDRPFVLGVGFGLTEDSLVTVGDRLALYVPVDALTSMPMELELASGMFRLLRADLQGTTPSEGLGYTAFEEGAARYFAVEQFSGFSEPDALGYNDAEWVKAQRQRPELVHDILGLFDSSDPDVLARYASAQPDGLDLPPRTAAYVGFLAVQRLRRTYSWDEIIRWDADTVRARMNQVLAVL
ncbi:MAG TPA: hypothetical protein V6D05_16580 [Stenomitos sp.]